jgi:SAM-dependent methyltransferase
MICVPSAWYRSASTPPLHGEYSPGCWQPLPRRLNETWQMTAPESGNPDYELRMWQELKRYRTVENVSDLPPIYQYWSDRYVAPKLRAIGFDSIDDFFMAPLMRRCADHPDRAVTVVSVGSGNAELEVRLATSLAAAGMTNVTITCLELNTAMNERAAAAARSAGVNSMLVFEESDFNSWTANQRYDVALASHSLHHVMELEHLFEQIREALQPDGRFLINDMIGRNGHLRWPEALALVQLVWATTPHRYRYNHQLSRFEELYENWDCSAEGFEGIRAQDILPLLLQRFNPGEFLAFANVIDLFVDRGFGHNLDPSLEEDRVFIDRVAQLDDLSIDLGLVKPTHMIASFGLSSIEPRFYKHWSPAFCVRDPQDTKPTITISPARPHLRPSQAAANPAGSRADGGGQLGASVEDLLDQVLHSTSWRATAPFRWAGLQVRRLVGQLRARR